MRFNLELPDFKDLEERMGFPPLAGLHRFLQEYVQTHTEKGKYIGELFYYTVYDKLNKYIKKRERVK